MVILLLIKLYSAENRMMIVHYDTVSLIGGTFVLIELQLYI
jgi:hypothetical protein